eukprot:TRINITY_DN13771_c0_g1_i2.p1 TRINITY_DN13771_c0_g1~~TRINITY_DN13771_c0_g1_i2.p1  ORF type:complete len:355 (+),score=52.31 TRINITY_DN13771_c0_g1_i2:142-1206(+)
MWKCDLQRIAPHVSVCEFARRYCRSQNRVCEPGTDWVSLATQTFADICSWSHRAPLSTSSGALLGGGGECTTEGPSPGVLSVLNDVLSPAIGRPWREMRGEYETASPFPHAVIDDLFSKEAIQAVQTEIPEQTSCDMLHSCARGGWECWDSEYERLKASPRHIGPATELLIWTMQSPRFLQRLEELTGIKGLVADPTQLGGGVHTTTRGGFLGVHADFAGHPSLGLNRRLNVLLYLNDGWQHSWGGHLELWGPTGPVVSLLPKAGRLVVFSTTPRALHGHPWPLACPPNRSRRSLALYYYAREPADSSLIPGSTLWVEWKLAEQMATKVGNVATANSSRAGLARRRALLALLSV